MTSPGPVAAEVLDLYRSLGGKADTPTLCPGGWDLAFAGGLVVELDEELHFNRYRAVTLAASWESGLPWAADYQVHCAKHEPACLAAGVWGKRWTNASAAAMFLGGAPGDLDGGGAPRWKQRALYDALKDTVTLLASGVRLARVATHDQLNGVTLGTVLDGLAPIDAGAVRSLVDARTR